MNFLAYKGDKITKASKTVQEEQHSCDKLNDGKDQSNVKGQGKNKSN